jgi:hypothetical protein
MDSRDVLVGSVVTVVAFSAYLLGAFQGQRSSVAWRHFFASCGCSLSLKGFLWAVAGPLLWLAIFYALVAHVRLALGRWPKFGESFTDWALSGHSQATWYFAGALVAMLYPAPLVAIGCLFFPPYRHVSIYSLTFAAAVGLAFGTMLLAPGPFLNWFFD